MSKVLPFPKLQPMGAEVLDSQLSDLVPKNSNPVDEKKHAEWKQDVATLSAGELKRKYARTYSSWSNAKNRVKIAGYSFDPALAKFRDFLRILGPRPSKHSLDRKDNSKGYTVDNVRWADKRTQSINRTNAKLLTCDGVTLPLAEWAHRTGQLPDTLRKRLVRAWSPQKIIYGLGAERVSRRPWPEDKAEQWEKLYRQNAMITSYSGRRETREQFFVRWCEKCLSMIDEEASELDPNEDDAPEELKRAYEHWQGRLRMAREALARRVRIKSD